VNWQEHADRLAAQAVHPASRWRPIIASLPRHLFVPRWWEWTAGDRWTLRDGPADRDAWMENAYANRSLVTQVAGRHADHADLDETRSGRPTSSSTMASLVIRMQRPGMGDTGHACDHRPGIRHRYSEVDGVRTAWMVHADGSWARATAHGTDTPIVSQGGPRRLWDIFDELRDYWRSHGYFQLYGGARAKVDSDGVIHLRRGRWEATITE
jgi:hypothetical protein